MANTTTTYQCFVCGSYLTYDDTTQMYTCPHCGIVQYGTPIQRFDEQEKSEA